MLGNQITSFGGYLRYVIRYRNQHRPRPPTIADVILHGNGITLYHVAKNGFIPHDDNQMEVSDNRNFASPTYCLTNTTRFDSGRASGTSRRRSCAARSR